MLASDARTDHFGFVVADLAASMGTLSDTFGITWREPTMGFERDFLVAGAHVCRWRLDVAFSDESPAFDDIAIELLRGDPGTTWHREGPMQLHHMAYRVPDVPGTCAELVEAGWTIDLQHDDLATRAMEFAYLLQPSTGRRVELLPLLTIQE